MADTADTAPATDATTTDNATTDTTTTDSAPDTPDAAGDVAIDAAAETTDSGCQTAASCPQPTAACQTAVCLAGSCTVTASTNGTACSDGVECTKNDSCQGGSCVFGTNTCQCLKDADCAAKEDGNFCNGVLYCDTVSHNCLVNPATAVSCPSVEDSDCLKNTCQPKTGACLPTPVKDNSACDDGDECTLSEVCKSGSCVAPAAKCACKVTADCQAQEDKNLCNGKLYCDVLSGTCKTNPVTVILCPGDDTACAKNTCDPATGQCQLKPVPDNLTCDDGNPCTAPGSCKTGQCIQGPDICPCSGDGDCAKLEDGDLCNGTLYCDVPTGTCKVNPATVQTCSTASDSACTKTVCDPKTKACVKKSSGDNASCDDGNPCTSGDTCQAGACKSGTNLCACKGDGDCLDDGNACNGLPFCDTAAQPAQCKVKPGSAVTCPAEKTGCTIQTCQPKTGLCGPGPGECDDGNPCTIDKYNVLSVSCKSLAAIDGAPCGAGQLCAAAKCVAVMADMALVAGGQTWLGCAGSDPLCAAAEQPQHLVKLPAYWIDRFEVTAAQYKACVDAGACAPSAPTDPACNGDKPLRSKHPINCVPWSAAQSYCTWAGKRLATEAEWEMAARGPCSSGDPSLCKAELKEFPWGSKPASCAQTVMADPVTRSGCGLGTTAAAGIQTADTSPAGVRDLGGNVSEWVLDTWEAGFYAASPISSPVNNTPGNSKVVRDGSFLSPAAKVRCAHRQSGATDAASPEVGVRCAKDAKP